MVNKKRYGGGVCLLVGCQFVMAAEIYIPDSYDTVGENYSIPRPYKKSPVKSVTIIKNGMKFEADKNDTEGCPTFKVTEKDIKEYFSKAKVVSNRDYMHEISWSECYASGEIRFSNGKVGKWRIQKYRAGSLFMDGKKYYFDCQRCRSKVYDEVLVY